MTPLLDIPTLAANLQNMQQNDLVPSEDGKVLYAGGVLRWYWYDFYYTRVSKDDKLKDAVTRTFETLRYVMSNGPTKQEFSDYETYLSPVVKKIVLPHLEYYRDFFKAYKLCDDPFLNSLNEIYSDVKKQIVLYQFEELSNRPIPHEDLQTLPLNEYSSPLRNWIKHLNRRVGGRVWFWERWLGEGQVVTGGDLYKVIKVICTFTEPVFMAMNMKHLGCELFDRPDPKFLLKRRRWVFQQKIRQKGTVFDLGTSVFTSLQTLIFHHKTERRFVVISDNRTRLKMERITCARFMEAQSKKFPIHFHRPEVSGEGFEVFRRFDFSLASPPWEENDWKSYADTLVHFFRYLMDNRFTPKKMSSALMGWIDGELYTAEALATEKSDLAPGSFHLWHMVCHLRKWTKGAEKVYLYIVENSGIDVCPENQFFEDVLKNLDKTILETWKDELNPCLERSMLWLFEVAEVLRKEAIEIGRDDLLAAYRRHKAFGIVDKNWD